MRINLPVTADEYPFPAGETLVSTTDLQGRILHCNASFVSVSGFTKDELLGQPHNIVRHPDMPEEAYRDMWATISQGLPWSAPVKNRRKDGRYYWVMANVTPLMEGDSPTGYMSVRTQATSAEIAAAEALYSTLREEKQQGVRRHRLEGGRVRLDTLGGRLARLLSVGIAGRLAMLCALMCAAGAVLAGVLAGSGFGWVAGTAAGAAVLGGAIGGALAFRLAVQPYAQLVATANRMAAGDLTQRFEARGEDALAQLTRALSQLNVNLRSIVRDARNEVEHLRDATGEIAAGNQDLSGRTESQAASLEETASSMEEITSTVRNSVASAQQAARLAEAASGVAQRGSEAMGEVTRTMHSIRDSSNRITEIIGVIEGIAFQTNILALNAAVEAARAGEQGRGFAVVASEVRALAQRSSSAAREIKQLIQASGETVEAGNRMTDDAQQTMANALESVRQVSQVISEISTGAQEQLTGISQVNEAVSQMDTITQQNAALVEQMAASAVQLLEQTASVAAAVQVFKLDARSRAQTDAVALRRQARDKQPA
jgi:aerotaxis receptor